MTDDTKNALEALAFIKQYAQNTYEYWDNDQDSKVGKRLIALSGGNKSYDPDLTNAFNVIHTALQSQEVIAPVTGQRLLGLSAIKAMIDEHIYKGDRS